MSKLAGQNTIASANIVGPMRFRPYWGPASSVVEYGLLYEELNTGELECSGRITPSADDDITHTHTHSEVKLFT